jgi:hypothetical protein
MGMPSDRLADLLADTPDDPLLLLGAMLLAWLPVCALVLGCLVLVAAVQTRLVRRRPRGAGIVLPPSGQRLRVTRRFITNPRRTNGLPAIARVALAVAVVVGFTALVLVSGGPLLLSSLGG